MLVQFFRQSVPLRESCVATRGGSLSFCKTTGVTKRSILKAIPGLEIVTDTVTNVTNISSLATKFGKNSGLVTIMATTFLCVDDQSGYFVAHYVLLDNH